MKKRLVREIVVQSLYHMEMNEVDLSTVVEMVINEGIEQYKTEQFSATVAHILDIVQSVWTNREEIDNLLVNFLKGWQLSRLSKVDRQILRLAAFEMIYTPDIPAKVAINEAIELSKHFGTVQSGKFVNGVLGQMIEHIAELKNQTLRKQ